MLHFFLILEQGGEGWLQAAVDAHININITVCFCIALYCFWSCWWEICCILLITKFLNCCCVFFFGCPTAWIQRVARFYYPSARLLCHNSNFCPVEKCFRNRLAVEICRLLVPKQALCFAARWQMLRAVCVRQRWYRRWEKELLTLCCLRFAMTTTSTPMTRNTTITTTTTKKTSVQQSHYGVDVSRKTQ